MNDELRLNYSKRDFTMYRVNLIYAPLAQLVEQLTLNQWVLGSSPRWCTKKGAVAHVTAPLLFVESKNKKHVFVKIKACATDFLENQKFSMDL